MSDNLPYLKGPAKGSHMCSQNVKAPAQGIYTYIKILYKFHSTELVNGMLIAMTT